MSAKYERETDCPAGIAPGSFRTGFWDRHASLMAFLVLAAVLAFGLSGLAGGRPSARSVCDFGAASLAVKTPHVIRNGEFFETDIRVRADAPVEDLVIAVSGSLWRDMTINTMIPAASEDSYADGEYRFSFGPVAPGDTLRFKIDGQINPPLFGGNSGSIAIYDGERPIGRRRLTVKVLP